MDVTQFKKDTDWILDEHKVFQVVCKDGLSIIAKIKEYRESYILLERYENTKDNKEIIEDYGECELVGKLLIPFTELKYIFLL